LSFWFGLVFNGTVVQLVNASVPFPKRFHIVSPPLLYRFFTVSLPFLSPFLYRFHQLSFSVSSAQKSKRNDHSVSSNTS
jgi:hypothetical protein